jgi:hypothetical protein
MCRYDFAREIIEKYPFIENGQTPEEYVEKSISLHGEGACTELSRMLKVPFCHAPRWWHRESTPPLISKPLSLVAPKKSK